MLCFSAGTYRHPAEAQQCLGPHSLYSLPLQMKCPWHSEVLALTCIDNLSFRSYNHNNCSFCFVFNATWDIDENAFHQFLHYYYFFASIFQSSGELSSETDHTFLRKEPGRFFLGRLHLEDTTIIPDSGCACTFIPICTLADTLHVESVY